MHLLPVSKVQDSRSVCKLVTKLVVFRITNKVSEFSMLNGFPCSVTHFITALRNISFSACLFKQHYPCKTFLNFTFSCLTVFHQHEESFCREIPIALMLPFACLLWAFSRVWSIGNALAFLLVCPTTNPHAINDSYRMEIYSIKLGNLETTKVATLC